MKLLILALVASSLLSVSAFANQDSIRTGNWNRREINRSLAESMMAASIPQLHNALTEFATPARIYELAVDQHITRFLLKNLTSRLDRKNAADVETLNRVIELGDSAYRLSIETSETVQYNFKPDYLELRDLPAVTIRQLAHNSSLSGADILASVAMLLAPSEKNFQAIFDLAAAKGMISTGHDYGNFLRTYFIESNIFDTPPKKSELEVGRDFEKANLERILDLVGKFDLRFSINRIYSVADELSAMRIAEEAIRQDKLIGASHDELRAFLTAVRSRTLIMTGADERNAFKTMREAAITHIPDFKSSNPSSHLAKYFVRLFDIGSITYALPSKTRRPRSYDVEPVVLAPSVYGPRTCSAVFQGV